MDVMQLNTALLILIQLMSMYITLDNIITRNRSRISKCRRHMRILITRLRRKRQLKVNRGLWRLERTSTFWEMEVPTYTDEMFKQNFRINRKGFRTLLQLLSCLKAKDTNFRTAIPLDKRIAVALYALGSSAEYRTTANLFGVGRTTVGELVRDFCEAVCNNMQAAYLSAYPPTQTKRNELVNGFEQMGFPQCMGAIDGCHIEICPSKSEAVDYYNYKGWYSIVLLAVVDHKCNFTYINVGSPGRNNDSHIFDLSNIKREHHANPLYVTNARIIEGVEVPILLIGDSAFPLTKFMMKPYPYIINQPPLQRTFNYNLSKYRRVVENSFGRLKARFRRLLKGLEVNITNAPLIIRGCCILSNFCNDNGDEVPEQWMLDVGDKDLQAQPSFITTIGNNSTHAVNIRNAIAAHINRNN